MTIMFPACECMCTYLSRNLEQKCTEESSYSLKALQIKFRIFVMEITEKLQLLSYRGHLFQWQL